MFASLCYLSKTILWCLNWNALRRQKLWFVVTILWKSHKTLCMCCFLCCFLCYQDATLSARWSDYKVSWVYIHLCRWWWWEALDSLRM